jgi:hypothetical protein
MNGCNKYRRELLNKQIWRSNNIYSMILGTLGCRLEADADPSSGFGPAQLSPPPSSLVSLSSTYLQTFPQLRKRFLHKSSSSSFYYLFLFLIAVSAEKKAVNFRASGEIRRCSQKAKTFFIAGIRIEMRGAFTVLIGGYCST